MKKHILIFAGLCAGLLLSFQNCTKTTYGTNENALKQSGGTGNGYDGKIYVVLSEIPCPDASHIKAAILVKDLQNEAYLIRESCHQVMAQHLEPQSFSILSDTQIEFRGTVYSQLPDVPVPTTPTRTNDKNPLFCARNATLNYDGFEGEVQMQINSASSPESAQITISSYAVQTNSRREIPPFIANVITTSTRRYYTFDNNQTSEYFRFSSEGAPGYGSYKLIGHDAESTANFGTLDYWNGAQPFSCRVLPW